jgi:flagellar basal-body rod modification protein FlgD
MDTNQFTSQLVQFTSVEEQINSNATLNSILTATQGQQLAQASSLVGQTAEFTSTSVPLQNSTGQIDYTVSGAQQVQITVTNSAGATVRSDTVNATAGANVWKWDGTSTSGAAEPDGTYTATVTTVPTVSGSTGTAVPFTVVGTITGAQQSNGTVQLMFGSEATTFDKVVKFSGSSSSTSSSTSSGS